MAKKISKALYATVGFVITMMLVSGCIFNFSSPKVSDIDQFIALHNNDEGKIGSGSYLSLMDVQKGEANFDHLVDIYPRIGNSMLEYVDVLGNQISLALHNDFRSMDPAPAGNHVHSWRGAVVDIQNKSWKRLPLLAASRPANEYTTIECTPTISESGHIIYVSGWNDRIYWDTWDHRVVRYNTSNDEFIAAKPVVDWAKKQPEASTATANAWVNRGPWFASDDGNFLYGSLWAGYYSGWVFSNEFSILCKYDIQNATFERLGSSTERKNTIYGWTADKKHILYMAGTDKKLLNVENNTTRDVTISVANQKKIRAKWNNSGFLTEGGNIIRYHDLFQNEMIDFTVKSPVKSAQFSADGSKIYYIFESNTGKYLCRMNGLTVTASIDTVCVLPNDVFDLIVKR